MDPDADVDPDADARAGPEVDPAPGPAFAQLPRAEHLPTRIAARLSLPINDGTLKPGERLPTEQALSRSFGVSRTVVREAIAQLRNEGLVETRQGVGAFVVARQVRQVRLQDAAKMDRHAFADLFQLRIPLEAEGAALAAVNRSTAQMAALDAAMARMAGTDNWGEAGVAADLDFHRTIAEATGNDYFGQFVTAIADRLGYVIAAARTRGRLDDVIASTLTEHREICEAIRARDPALARSAMRRHLQRAARRVGLDFDFI